MQLSKEVSLMKKETLKLPREGSSMATQLT